MPVVEVGLSASRTFLQQFCHECRVEWGHRVIDCAGRRVNEESRIVAIYLGIARPEPEGKRRV